MSNFFRYDDSADGFRVVAGRDQGLSGFLLAAGRVPADEGGPLHLHHGDELLRILEGELDVTVGEETRRCTAGEVVAIPADTLHGFTTITEVRMEVVSVLDAGQLFPVFDADGNRSLIEVYRQDMPWGRRPPPGFDWTTDAQLRAVLEATTPPASGGR